MTIETATDETLLLDLLNTTPVVDGTPQDLIGDAEAGRAWLAAHAQPASDDEWHAVLDVRSTLQTVIRGDADPTPLAPYVDGVRYRATLSGEGVAWRLEPLAGRSAAALAVLTWDALRVSAPGRLRPCANPECRRFLIDHSKPNSARWCSMSLCGNRMKARRHYQRTRQA